MAEQTITLPAARFFTSHARWSWVGVQNWPAIDSALTDGNSRFLEAFVINNTGVLTLLIAANVGEGGGRADLSSMFEQQGSVTITYAGVEYTALMQGADTEEPYSISSNTADFAALYAILNPLGNGNASATLTLRDRPASDIYLGSTRIDKMYLGSTEISAAYLGDTKIFG